MKNNSFIYAAMVCFCAPTSVMAQSGEEAGAIEEVFVTAQRKLQNNQKVALAVTAITEEQFERGTIESVLDIGPQTPGLVVTSYNVANPQIFVRGIGSTGTTASEESSVIFFSDEVYSGRTGTAGLGYLDVERVEVLRGPQGTLFGRNAAGGVVHLISKKPTQEFEANTELTLGNYGRTRLSGVVNGGLSDSLSARLSLAYDEKDGYVTNTTTGTDNLREGESYASRLHLLSEFSDTSQLLITLDHAKTDELGPSTRKLQAYSDPLVVVGFIPVAQPGDDIYSVTLASDGPSHRQTSGVNIKFDHELSFGVFESITGWRESKYDHVEDISSVGLVLLGQDENSDLITQEFKLSSLADSTVQWVGGLFYMKEKVDRVDTSDLSAISDAYNAATNLGLPPNRVSYTQTADTQSYAVFAQAEVPLTSTLSFTVGGRVTKDEKESSLDASGFDFMGLGLLDAGSFSAEGEKDFSRFTGKLGLTYTPNDDVMAYATYSQGYKSGGFNGIATSEDSFLTPFNEETADSYEVGLKSQWWDDRLRSNIAVYYTDYDDLQVFQVRANGNQFISNAASARLQGVELELTAHWTSYFYSNLAVSFMDNEYKDFISEVDDDNDGSPDNLEGKTLTRSPEYTYSISLDFLPPVPTGTLDIQVQYQYQDDLYTTPQNRELDKVDSFGLVNFSAIYELEKLTFTLFAKNLLDEEYELHSYDANPSRRDIAESTYFGDPRTFGLKVRYEF